MNAMRVVVVDEQRVGRAVARARDDRAQRPPARDDALAVGEPDVGAEVLGAAAQVVPEALVVGDDVGRGRRGGP